MMAELYYPPRNYRIVLHEDRIVQSKPETPNSTRKYEIMRNRCARSKVNPGILKSTCLMRNREIQSWARNRQIEKIVRKPKSSQKWDSEKVAQPVQILLELEEILGFNLGSSQPNLGQTRNLLGNLESGQLGRETFSIFNLLEGRGRKLRVLGELSACSWQASLLILSSLNKNVNQSEANWSSPEREQVIANWRRYLEWGIEATSRTASSKHLQFPSDESPGEKWATEKTMGLQPICLLVCESSEGCWELKDVGPEGHHLSFRTCYLKRVKERDPEGLASLRPTLRGWGGESERRGGFWGSWPESHARSLRRWTTREIRVGPARDGNSRFGQKFGDCQPWLASRASRQALRRWPARSSREAQLLIPPANHQIGSQDGQP